MIPDKEQWKNGKTKFNETHENNDFSGRDFTEILFDTSVSLSHGFFNGVTIMNCFFDSTLLDQCEFAESQFKSVFLKSTNLTGSDFVSAQFEDVIFEDCDFTNGEWRDSQFVRVTFKGCIFKHTTINLCVFDDCVFCAESTKWLDHDAVNYNVFSKTMFNSVVQSTTVLSKNFSLPGNVSGTSIVSHGRGITLEEFCLSSASGQISIHNFVAAIEDELLVISQTRMKKLRLAFISNIISSLANEKAISVSSMICIENIFSNLAQSATNESDFRAAMSAFINIRNSIFECSVNLAEKWAEYDGDYCSRITIRYNQTFQRVDVDDLAEILGYLVAQDFSALYVSEVRYGSTIIELSTVSIMSVSAFLMAVNLVLQQATITVKRFAALKKAVSKKSLVRTGSTRTKKVSAIMTSQAMPIEYKKVKEVIELKGDDIVRFDEKADIIIHATRDLERKKRGR